MIDTDLLHQTFTRTCEAAAKETLPRFRTGTRVSNKLDAGFDPVTEADREAEVAIRAVIAEAFPAHSIFGEEHGASGPDNSPWRWIIDPVDGTRAFISGLPVWGTLIGLYHEGKPVAGALDQPFTGERFLALPDGYCVSTNRFGIRDLSTSDVTSLADATIMTVDPHLLDNDDDRGFFACAERAKLVRYGCDCYAYAMVAGGHVDAVVESHMQVYDIAALIPLIVNAGGVVTDWQGGDASEGGQVLACANATLHAEMMAVLNS
ncbi:MAG: histidinol-phosphatase [Pseudomonadota bacterium]